VNRSDLVSALAVVFGALAAFLAVVGVVVEPLVLLLAVPFAVVTYVMWYQASGRLVERLYATVEEGARVDDRARGRRARAGAGERSGGFGAGPRAEWETRDRVSGPGPGERRRGRRGQRGGRRRRSPRTDDGPTAREAYDVLDLSPDADSEAVRRAYREKVKFVHPDAEGGSEEAFKRVNAAYERLSE
jgi:hypothetical protein